MRHVAQCFSCLSWKHLRKQPIQYRWEQFLGLTGFSHASAGSLNISFITYASGTGRKQCRRGLTFAYWALDATRSELNRFRK